MTKTIAVIVTLLIAGGCESAVTTDRSPNKYQPTDGRNLAPSMQEASHGDPQWPADIDRGGGGGPR